MDTVHFSLGASYSKGKKHPKHEAIIDLNFICLDSNGFNVLKMLPVYNNFDHDFHLQRIPSTAWAGRTE